MFVSFKNELTVPLVFPAAAVQVNLTDVAGSPVTEFSGGMKRRLSVALASVGDPDIIFLDVSATFPFPPQPVDVIAHV